MPKSKRSKIVSLTATKKKGVELKEKLVNLVKDAADKYERIFLFSVKNMRTCKLTELREEWHDSKFIFGKNRVIARALGNNVQDEYKDNLHKISQYLSDQKGLLFTNRSVDDVKSYFDKVLSPNYARTDEIATKLIELEEGPLKQFDGSMEPFLRSLGLSTSLKRGIINLNSKYTVCDVGEKLTAEKAKLLKLLGIQLSEFKICIEMMWSSDGHVKIFDKDLKKKIKKVSKNNRSKKDKVSKDKNNEIDEDVEVDVDVDDNDEDNEDLMSDDE